MFKLSEKLSKLVSGAQKNLKKEKNAQISAAVPAIASGFKEPKGLAGMNKEPETKPESNLVLTDKPQDSTVSRVADNVSKPMMKNPGVKIAYKRNTGIADVDGSPYTNADDISLLAKLGYSIDKNVYLFLPRGEEREDLYSYVEKVAGVSKDVARCIDQGTAFSSEHLKDMDYEVPEGYEIKGDLVCPIEKKADLTNTQPAMSGNSNVLQATHSPINIQTSTQGQTTPVDSAAKNNALVAAGKSFANDQLWGALPGMIGLGGGKLRNIASSVGPRMSARAAKGINALESGAHVGVGEVSATQADDPRTAGMDRGLSYLNSALSYAPNPVVQGAALAGNVMYDAANAADVYHKTMPSAPPSMGSVPEQKFNIPFNEPASNNIDFRLTQPNLRDQYPSSGVRLAKRGQIELDKIAAFIGARPGMVTNFPPRTTPPPSVGDRVGSLLMGRNYIPSPIDGESMYDAMLRSGRNADMLEISRKTFGNNPLFHRLGLNKNKLSSMLGVADYMTQGKLSSILSPINGGNTYQANKNIREMLSDPSIMSQFKQASSNQPLLPGMKQWSKKQPFNYAEDAYKRGRIPKHVRDDIVSGRAAEQYRPKFKEMLESIERSRRKN